MQGTCIKIMSTGYLSLGRGLAVTGQIRYIGQRVLQSSFQKGSSSSPSYFHIFFLIAFLSVTKLEEMTTEITGRTIIYARIIHSILVQRDSWYFLCVRRWIMCHHICKEYAKNRFFVFIVNIFSTTMEKIAKGDGIFKGLRKIVYLSSVKTSRAYKTDEGEKFEQLILCSPSIESNAEGSGKKMAASTWICHFTNSNNLQEKPSTCVQWTSLQMSLQTHTIICTGHRTHYRPTTANTGRNIWFHSKPTTLYGEVLVDKGAV